MGNCHYLFRPEKMRTIEVRKRAAEQPDICKDEIDSLVACWRTSGVDSRSCASLVSTLHACISTSNIMSKARLNGRGTLKLATTAPSTASIVEKFNSTLAKYLKRK